MLTLEPMDQDKTSRFDHKAAESQWRGMSAQDRNTFNRKWSEPSKTFRFNLWHIAIAILLAVGAVGLITQPSCPIQGVICHD